MNTKENDKFAWSGTNYFIISSLKDRFEVKYFEAKPTFTFFSKCLIKVYCFFNKNTNIYPVFINRLIYKDTINKAKTYSKIILTTMGIYASLCKGCYYVIDAVYKSLLNYYYFNVRLNEVSNLNNIQKKALKNAKHIFCASQWVIDEAKKNYNISSNKMSVVPFGANMTHANRVNKTVNNKKNINLLFIGADYKRKGLDIAIEINNTLNKIDSKHNYILNVVGTNGSNNNNVIYYGKLNKSNLTDYNKCCELLKMSDLFILPTKAECYGIVFCEAAMYSTPSITYNTGGVSSCVLDQKNGLLFDISSTADNIANSILNLINSPEKYKYLSENARDLYEKIYNWNSWGYAVSKSILSDK